MKQMGPAEGLLRRLGVETPQDIDLEAIAWSTGADVRYEPLDACEARIIGNAERAIITVNSRANPGRRRFSTAHELGHWRLHRGRSFVCRSQDIDGRSGATAQFERQADAFAADLLMPEYLFQPMAEGFKMLDLTAVEELAHRFSTSFTATARRATALNARPSMLLCYGQKRRKWFLASAGLSEGWWPKDEIDAGSSALGVQFGAQVRGRQTRVSAHIWFERREAFGCEVLEQAQRCGEETLVLLSFDRMSRG